MIRNAGKVVLIALGLVAVAGCETSPSSSTFNRSEVGVAQTVEWGTITAIRDVTIQNDSRGVATVTGALLGGIAGSTIGRGTRANTAGAVAGAAAGGAVGRGMARGNHPGVEITVQLESGRTVAVAQDGRSTDYRVGDRVRVTTDGAVSRVTL